MTFVLLPLCLFLMRVTLSNGYTEVEATSNTCFNAADGNAALSYKFNAPLNGVISGVRLEHNSGGTTCRPDRAQTNWGCITSAGNRFWTNLLRIDSDETSVGNGETLYPTGDTNEITVSGSCGTAPAYVYQMDNNDINDDDFTLQSDTTSYQVSTDDTFVLGASEAVCSTSTSDNSGTSCAKVYFLYEEIFTCGVDDSCDVNIVFVMDSSGSVGATGWDQEVDFVEGIMDALGSGSQIGIIEFDSAARTLWPLCDVSDCDLIKAELNANNLAGGGTRIGEAVQAGADTLNSACAPDLPKVMVVITDGFGSGLNPCDVDITGISVYLVKVGAGISNTAVDCLVLNTNTDIFEASSFDDIMELSDQVTTTVCDGPQCDLELDYCDNDPCDCGEVTNCQVCNQGAGCAQCQSGYFKFTYDSQCSSCQEVFGDGCLFCQDFNGCGQCADGYQRVQFNECEGLYGCKANGNTIECNNDIILAIDESGSLDDGEYALEIKFALDLVDLIDIESDIGVLEFGTTVEEIFELGSGDSNAVKNAISNMIQDGGFTNYFDTINDAITAFNDHGTADQGNVLVIISDGQPNTGGNACDLKDDLDDNEVTVVIVGIGNGFSASSSSITCLVDDTERQIFTAESFTQAALDAILLEVALEVCQFTCPNGVQDSSLDLDDNLCPIECSTSPCQCCDLCFCNICHPNGCDECYPGYFKKDYNFPCVNCQEFDDKCLFCQDHNGCAQCRSGYNRYFDYNCGLWKCY